MFESQLARSNSGMLLKKSGNTRSRSTRRKVGWLQATDEVVSKRERLMKDDEIDVKEGYRDEGEENFGDEVKMRLG